MFWYTKVCWDPGCSLYRVFVVVLEGGELVGGGWKWVQINKVVPGCACVRIQSLQSKARHLASKCEGE